MDTSCSRCLQPNLQRTGDGESMNSEIRDSQILALSERVRKRAYTKYLSGMRLIKLRGFRDREIRFDFPVTALVGPNGAGKSTILGAAGLIYDTVVPRRFFAKSGAYDDSMKGWRIEYDLVDRDRPTASPTTIARTASYLRAKWNRDAVARSVVVIGIGRTLPATERKDLYRFVGGDFQGVREEDFAEPVVEAVERILGKTAANYLKVDADKAGQWSIFAVRNTSQPDESYSEFHFGAGEASIIRIVSRIENAPNDSLILIEEIENGLHPVATRRLVEYLIDVARRKSCQVLFTTHSNDALVPLPNDAIWSAYQGRLTQGKLDVAALRTLTGQIDAQIAVFTEDAFDEMFADVTLRAYGNIDRASVKIMHSEERQPLATTRGFTIQILSGPFLRSACLTGTSAAKMATSQSRLNTQPKERRVSGMTSCTRLAIATPKRLSSTMYLQILMLLQTL